MFAFVRGILDSVEDGAVVIDTGGVGYYINCSNNTIASCGNIGDEVKLYTKLIVREDDMSLCGFYSIQERRMFEQLNSISGVGVKIALQILSSINIQSLIMAIINQDVKALTQAKGVGKKMAERIILELKEKVDISNTIDINSLPIAGNMITADSDDIEDAILGLMSLGYTRMDAQSAIMRVKGKAQDVDSLIMLALRGMNN